MSDTNPFRDLRDDTNEAIGKLLGRLRGSGDWDDRDAEMLAQWREARGEAAMGPWMWWAGPIDELYEHEVGNREAAIQEGERDYASLGRFQIVEARLWDDDVEEDENCMFAATRNHEIIEVKQ